MLQSPDVCLVFIIASLIQFQPILSQENKPCNGICSTGYYLNLQCQCELLIADEKTCPGVICQVNLGANENCECVPLLLEPKERCEKSCIFPFSLEKKQCKCKCPIVCGGHFKLDKSLCSCECTLKCSSGLYLDKKLCKCLPDDCDIGEEFVNGKCVAVIKNFCEPDELLIDAVCVKTKFCPPGYVKLPNRRCQQICCSGDCAADQRRCAPQSCGKDQYLINGVCKEVKVTPCPDKSFFNFIKPSCFPTCEQPVPLGVCDKSWPGPGCSCHHGFLHNNGDCVRPDKCPNKPLCIKNADFAFMLDSSSTIRARDFALMKAFVEALIHPMDLEKGDVHRLALVQYGFVSEAVVHFDGFDGLSKQDFLKQVRDLEYKGGNAYFGEALRHVRSQVFQSQRGLRHDVPRILFLLTDGSKTDGQLSEEVEAQDLREDGVQIIILKVGSHEKEKIGRLYQLAGEEGKVFVFGLRSFRELSTVIDKILTFDCEDFICPAPRLKPKKCIGEYRFYDKEEFVKVNDVCKANQVVNATKRRCGCPPPVMNVSKCIDNYETITKTNHIYNPKEKICETKVTKDKRLCGCPPISFSETGCVNEHRTITITNYTLHTSFDRGRYCRRVITARVERCGCPPPEVKHDECKAGYRLVHVKSYRFVHNATDCAVELKDYEERCSCPQPKVHVMPCDGNKMLVSVRVYQLNPRKECSFDLYTGSANCKHECSNVSDIGIIIDTSSSMKPTDFAIIKNFLKKLVGTFPMGPNATQVALMTYSSPEEIKLITNFRAYLRVSTLQDRIEELVFPSGSTSTGQALRIYRKTALLETQGCRIAQHVPQIVILLTDGSPSEESDSIMQAEKLKRLGVKIIIVAIKNPQYEDIAKQMVSEPSSENLFQIESFNDLTGRLHDIASRRCASNMNADPERVKFFYLNAIEKLSTSNRGAVTQLAGSNFSKLNKLNVTQFCEITFSMNAHLAFVAGTTQLERNSFKLKLRTDIGKAVGIEANEIVQMKFSPHSLNNSFEVQFRADCKAVDKFESLIATGKFVFQDRSNKTVNIPKNSTAVISPYTKSVIGLTEDIDLILRDALDILFRYPLTNETIIATLKKKLRINEYRLAHTRQVSKLNENRTLGLAVEVQRNSLAILKEVQAALKYIDDYLERRDAEQRITHITVPVEAFVKLSNQMAEKSKKRKEAPPKPATTPKVKKDVTKPVTAAKKTTAPAKKTTKATKKDATKKTAPTKKVVKKG